MDQNINQGLEQAQPMQGAIAGAPVYNAPTEDMTVKKWLVTFLITCIPVVGFVMLIVWAASSSPQYRARKTWAIAAFVWAGIILAISIVLGLIVGFGALMLGATV